MNTDEKKGLKLPEVSAKKPSRKSLTRDDIFRLDDEELTIVDVIRDLNRLGVSRMGATEDLVIRQAKRERLSERRAKEAISNLVKLGVIKYPEIYRDEYEACEEPYTGVPVDDICPELRINSPWEDIPGKPTRKPLTLSDFLIRDEEEDDILDLIRALKNLKIEPTKELVIRQAKRTNFSERKAKKILDNLYATHNIRYTYGGSEDDDREFERVFPAVQYIEITSLEEDQERERINKSHIFFNEGLAAWSQAFAFEEGVSKKNGYEKALQKFEEVIRLNPQNKEAWVRKGKILEALGRKKESEEAFARAASMELDKGNVKKE